MHFSTCVMLMVGAGLLLGLNMHDSKDPITEIYQKRWEAVEGRSLEIEFATRGWPSMCRIEIYEAARAWSIWRTGALALDIAVAVFVLLSIAVVCEWRIRRRLRREAPKL